MLPRFHHILCFIFAALLFNTSAFAAEENTDPYQDRLLNDMSGLRGTLADHGVDVTLEYKGDLMNNVAGGLSRGGNYLDNLDMKLALDNEKLAGWHGNNAVIYFVNNNGGHPNSRVGSIDGINGNEPFTNQFKLLELWDEQHFFDDHLAILLGIRDINAEFEQTDMTANFLRPTFQLSQEFAQTGKAGAGPSTFPYTAPAARVKISPSKNSYLQFGAFNAVNGDPYHIRDDQALSLNFHGGQILIAEAGITPAAQDNPEVMPNKLAVGGWRYTQKFDDLIDVDTSGNPVQRHSQGAYLVSSYQFYHNKAAKQNLGAFFRAGASDDDIQAVDWSYQLGMTGNGWLPKRVDSEIGLGFTQSHISDKYIHAQQIAGDTSEHNEYGVELYYRDRVYPGIAVQPDLQYIINPGATPQADNALELSLRLDVNF